MAGMTSCWRCWRVMEKAKWSQTHVVLIDRNELKHALGHNCDELVNSDLARAMRGYRRPQPSPYDIDSPETCLWVQMQRAMDDSQRYAEIIEVLAAMDNKYKTYKISSDREIERLRLALERLKPWETES